MKRKLISLFILACNVTLPDEQQIHPFLKSQVKFIVLSKTSLLEQFANCYFILWQIESNSITVHIIEKLQPTMTKSSRTPDQSSYLGSFGRETLTHQTVSPLTRALNLPLKQTLKQRTLTFQSDNKRSVSEARNKSSKWNKNVISEDLKVSK